MMKKKLLAIILVCMLVASALTVVACTDPVVKHKVTFLDGKNVLKEVEVEDGKLAEAYTPTKDGGYQFIDWFSTPSFGHKFDFTKPITEDTSVFAGFTLFKDDTRTYYVVGSGTSELLLGQDWGKNINDSHKLTKVEGKNEHTITLDLLEGDEFQFAISSAWENKRGFGYLVTDKLPDGTVAFTGEGGGLGEVTAKGRNIKVAKAGNYTFTLKTYPNEDTYNTSDPTYTEAGKEVYNVGTFDTIEFVRNGDPLVTQVVVTNLYIKGSLISNWADMFNAATTMTKVGDTYTLVTYMKEGDEFMFASYNSSADGVSAGSVFVKSNALDEASRNVVDGYTEAGGNIKIKTSGVHTFVYNKATEKLTVTVDASKGMTVYDYYLDGKTDAGLSWKEADLPQNKLVETEAGSGIFELKNVVLAANDEIVIRSFEKDSKPAYSAKLTDYNATYLLPKLAATANFSAISDTNSNIKVLTAGKYNVSFNAYTKILTIAPAEAAATAYVKGSGIESWGNKPESGKMTLVDGKFELTLTMAVNDEIMVQYFAPGDETQNGLAFVSSNVTEGAVNAKFDLTKNNIKCITAGTYKIVFDPTAGKITISESEAAVATAYVKGSAIESWGNKPESGKMTLKDGKFELILTMAVNDEIMIQYFAVDETSEWGAAIKAGDVAEGAANAKFDLTKDNIKCATAGTYKFVFDPATSKIAISECAPATAYVKGSGIESWGNKPESGKMTLKDGKFELTLTIAVNDEIMVQYFAVGDESQWGAAFNSSNVVEGEANAKFDLTGNNIKCTTAGTYVIVFDPVAETISIAVKAA